MRNKKLPPEHIALISNLYHQGYSTRAICALLKVSTETVYRYLKRAGVANVRSGRPSAPPPRPARVVPEVAQSLRPLEAALLRRGATYEGRAAIARDHGVAMALLEAGWHKVRLRYAEILARPLSDDLQSALQLIEFGGCDCGVAHG